MRSRIKALEILRMNLTIPSSSSLLISHRLSRPPPPNTQSLISHAFHLQRLHRHLPRQAERRARPPRGCQSQPEYSRRQARPRRRRWRYRPYCGYRPEPVARRSLLTNVCRLLGPSSTPDTVSQLSPSAGPRSRTGSRLRSPVLCKSCDLDL